MIVSINSCVSKLNKDLMLFAMPKVLHLPVDLFRIVPLQWIELRSVNGISILYAMTRCCMNTRNWAGQDLYKRLWRLWRL